MNTILVNGVSIDVADKRKGRFDHYWHELKGTGLMYRIPDSAHDVMTAAGHDASQIDTAVPQSWWDAQYKRNGEAPRAWWTYEHNLFGEPLYVSTVLYELEAKLYTAWEKAGK